ncbi:LOW QUALITY PROTEIN: protein AF-17 [Boleophthalmus pectinirostris]|uniref:LOW QUALITY PROTEIN: protein AF-17 n=1 Tax=Boleophthalmus pectinirostris TaxID=150288 RepID=UPI002430960D|nr:LOW QUALITY PROTEIN: protein AF-17 [Boleophthalmus pectinirostris]
MREMVGGCCVCSDERGWAENPLVYCDGHGCSVAVHQACYGIVQVPTGPWFCRKCESQERAARVRCELCPHKDGALKRTDSGGWAHVVCALYIPEVQFANVLTMEPIILQYVPHERYIKTCYICEDHGRESKAACGACMTCNRQGCRQAFHVTCAQMAGLLCEEEGPEADNVKYVATGYCKHHYNKMQKKLRSSENTSSSFSHSRARPSSPPPDKHHHHHKPRKSHKDKTRPKDKDRHKKSSDSLSSSVTSSSIEKISSHHISKDSESKSKKLSSHSHSHRSKKPGSTGKSSSSSCSSSPFNTAGSLSTSQDFHQFSSSSSRHERDRDHDRSADDHHNSEDRKERHRRPAVREEEEDEEEKEEKDDDDDDDDEDSKYHKPPALTPADGPIATTQSHDRTERNSSSPFENKVTISTIGSIMRITSSSGTKIRKISSSSVDYKPSKSLKVSQLSTPPILEEVDREQEEEGKTTPPPSLPRERRHRGSKKSRHGPGRPKGSKNRDRRGDEEHHHHHTVPPTAPALNSHYQTTTTSTAVVTSSSSVFSSSTSAGSFSTSRGNSLLGTGIYSSLKEPLTLGGVVSTAPLSLGGGVSSGSLSLGGGVCCTSLSLAAGVCSTPLSSGLLPSHASSLSLPTVNSVSSSQVHPVSSTSYSLASSQLFSSCLSSASTLPPLLSQPHTSLPEVELDDCRFPCQGNSPRESLSSQSPMSCLPLLFDHRDGLGPGSRTRPENVPPASSHIELLLEKHGNGEMGVNIVEMLQSLHSLQRENQRLQDQILSLTAKRERLQLLNTELAVPFPPQALNNSVSASLHPSAQINFLSASQDPLSSNKSPLSKSCFLNDTSFVTSSEELHSGSPSRSSSSLSFQSTPPPQQSPASFGQPLLNGLGRGLSDGLGTLNQSGGSSLPAVGGLIASLTGSPQLGMNGVLGSLNGVIQSPVHSAPQPTLPALRPQPPPLNPQVLAQSFQLPKSVSPSSLLSEQQKQLLLEQQQQQQQQQQLQQFLTSQNFTPEQQVVVCQMLQQQRQRELQRLSLAGALSSTPNSPLIASSASPLQTGQGGSLFGLQDNTLHKTGGPGEKSGDKNG